jgi:hypothetical protein
LKPFARLFVSAGFFLKRTIAVWPGTASTHSEECRLYRERRRSMSEYFS